MLLNDALNQSRIQAARGFDAASNCVVSVASYGGQLMWMTGWNGNWVNDWLPIPSGDMSKLDGLDFRPTGPPPPMDDHDLLVEIYSEIEDIAT